MSAINSPPADAGDDPVRIGIIGLGNIGHYHADRLRDLPVDLVGGVDINAEARTRFGAKYETQVFNTAGELFATDPDGVIITTPNRFHEEYAVAASEADVAVFLEKPLAHTLKSAERIAKAAEDADTFCVVGFHTRFYSSVRAIKGYQDAGRFGEIVILKRISSVVAASLGGAPGLQRTRLLAVVPSSILELSEL